MSKTTKTAVALAMAAALSLAGLAGCNGGSSAASDTSQETSAAAQKAAVDASRLDAAIEGAKALEQGDKTKEARAALDAAIAAAEKAAKDGKATQKDVDAAVTALENAVKAFKASKTGSEAFNEALEEAYGPGGSAAEPESEQATGESRPCDEPAYDSGGGGGYTEPAPGGGSGGSGNGGGSAPQPAAPAAPQPAPEPQKTWVDEQGHYEAVAVEAAWDEPIYERHAICAKCGLDFTATGTNAAGHIDECGGFATSTQVQVGSVHHDAVTEQQWVVDVPGHWE